MKEQGREVRVKTERWQHEKDSHRSDGIADA